MKYFILWVLIGVSAPLSAASRCGEIIGLGRRFYSQPSPVTLDFVFLLRDAEAHERYLSIPVQGRDRPLFGIPRTIFEFRPKTWDNYQRRAELTFGLFAHEDDKSPHALIEVSGGGSSREIEIKAFGEKYFSKHIDFENTGMLGELPPVRPVPEIPGQLSTLRLAYVNANMVGFNIPGEPYRFFGFVEDYRENDQGIEARIEAFGTTFLWRADPLARTSSVTYRRQKLRYVIFNDFKMLTGEDLREAQMLRHTKQLLWAADDQGQGFRFSIDGGPTLEGRVSTLVVFPLVARVELTDGNFLTLREDYNGGMWVDFGSREQRKPVSQIKFERLVP